jgi:hypothetical protein
MNRAFVATVKGRRNSLSPSRWVFKEREIRKRDKRLLLLREDLAERLLHQYDVRAAEDFYFSALTAISVGI